MKLVTNSFPVHMSAIGTHPCKPFILQNFCRRLALAATLLLVRQAEAVFHKNRS